MSTERPRDSRIGASRPARACCLDFIAELYARLETSDVIRALGRLDELMGSDSDDKECLLLSAPIHTLASCFRWCKAHGRPFASFQLLTKAAVSIYELAALQAEWKEGRQGAGL